MGQCAHLRNFATLGDCEVVALAELREGLGKAVAGRYGVPRVYRDHRELLDNESLDGIVAIQMFDRHGGLLPDLYAAGVPVLTEKPLAAFVEVGRRLLQALAQTAASHYVAYHKRSDPATMETMKRISELRASGELGAMRFVRITMPPGDWIQGGFNDLIHTDEPYPNIPPDPVPEGMEAAAVKEFIAFINYYIHQIDLMRHLLGEGYRVTHADPSGVLMVARSDSGVVGTLEMATYFTTVDWQESATVTFEKGWIRLDLPPPMVRNRPGRVTLYHDPGNGLQPRTIVPELAWVDAMRQQAVNFIKQIRGESTCLCPADEALADLETASEYMELLKTARSQ